MPSEAPGTASTFAETTRPLDLLARSATLSGRRSNKHPGLWVRVHHIITRYSVVLRQSVELRMADLFQPNHHQRKMVVLNIFFLLLSVDFNSYY